MRLFLYTYAFFRPTYYDFVSKYKFIFKGGERVRIELRPFEELEDLSKDIKNSESSTKSSPIVSSISDTSPVENFLLGKNCLNGVCFNKIQAQSC